MRKWSVHRAFPTICCIAVLSSDILARANRGGDEWSETCTVWDDGHQYDIAVDTSDYPYPLAEMRGSWSTGATSPAVVSMDFRYRPRPGIRGRLFAAAMQAAFPMVLGRIIRGWRQAAASRVAAD